MTAFPLRRRHPLAGVVVLLLALVVVGGVYAAFAPTSSAQDASAAQDVAAGEQLFTVGCATCHGLRGQGVTGDNGHVLGPSLIGVGAAAVDFQVGTGRMPVAAPEQQIPQKNVVYSPDQIRQLAAFVDSLGGGPAIPSPEQYDPTQGDAAQGGQIFRYNCSSCHNFAGQGGVLTYGKYAPPIVGTEPRYIYEAMLTGPQAMPVFADTTITAQQKRDIIAYISSLDGTPNPGGLGIGRIGPVSEGLWAWLVLLGGIVGAATWLAKKSS